MADDTDEDVPLLNDDADDPLNTLDDRPPQVEAVFVVTFDVKSGNMIEFQLPDREQMPLKGVEYKAIPSGSHHIYQDFVYFRHEDKYGLACIARTDVLDDDNGSALSTIDPSQRGLRIKSIGILTSSIIHIQSYLQILQAEAKTYVTQPSVNYNRLRELLVHDGPIMPVPISTYDALFNDFVQHFGPAIFPLSRLILLGKRILLYSSSPIGPLCNAVYFTHFLNQSVNPLFYVTVMDLTRLANEQSYIGCTTEKILQEKTTLFDAFVNCDNRRDIAFQTSDSLLQSIIKITRNDRNRLKKSMTLNSFINIGNRLSRVLDRISKSTDHQQMTNEDFRTNHFHPQDDRRFLEEYFRIHHIPNVLISHPAAKFFSHSPCCSCPTTN